MDCNLSVKCTLALFSAAAQKLASRCIYGTLPDAYKQYTDAMQQLANQCMYSTLTDVYTQMLCKSCELCWGI
ncbi:unnamed protein product [Rhodiola kirilowii]